MIRTKLINRRTELGLTQEQVADKAKISRTFYCNIEVGRKNPSIAVANAISAALESTVDEIFFDYDVPKRNEDSA